MFCMTVEVSVRECGGIRQVAQGGKLTAIIDAFNWLVAAENDPSLRI